MLASMALNCFKTQLRGPLTFVTSHSEHSALEDEIGLERIAKASIVIY